MRTKAKKVWLTSYDHTLFEASDWWKTSNCDITYSHTNTHTYIHTYIHTYVNKLIFQFVLALFVEEGVTVWRYGGFAVTAIGYSLYKPNTGRSCRILA